MLNSFSIKLLLRKIALRITKSNCASLLGVLIALRATLGSKVLCYLIAQCSAAGDPSSPPCEVVTPAGKAGPVQWCLLCGHNGSFIEHSMWDISGPWRSSPALPLATTVLIIV